VRFDQREAKVRGGATTVLGIERAVPLPTVLSRNDARTAGLESAIRAIGDARLVVVRLAPGVRLCVLGVVSSVRQEEPRSERRRCGTVRVVVNFAPDSVRVVRAMVSEVDHRGDEDLDDEEREPAPAAADAAT
jgi:hypothetical protein